MRIPEQQRQHRSGQQFQEDSAHFLQPGAFTVLSSDNVPPPDPPMAPQPYRLATPNSRRHKNHSFAIIAELGSSRSGSRSPSPSGRVSPFRGRGFNPAGSRHASPTPSPPPSGIQSASSSRSKIPKLTRRGSASVFGERIDDYLSSPNRRKLHSQLSQSLTNISTRKPPPSPRRQQQQQQQRQSGHSRSFQRLSPIIGSSPEPSQSQSSPATRSNKPSSRPESRYNSPSRSRLPPPSSQDGRNSRQRSRDPSPNKIPISPSRIPVKNNYKNVQSKVNSFNRNNKPKVPPKPQVLSETSDSSDINRGNNTYRTRTESFKKLKTNPKSSNLTSRNSKNDAMKPNQDNKNGNRNNESHDQNGNKIKNKSGDANLNSDTMTDKTNNNSNTNRTHNNNNNNNRSQGNHNSNNNNDSNNTTKSNNNDKVAVSSSTESEDNKKSNETPVKLSDLLQPSTTAVVSSTTTTVTQPLKIEAKMEQNTLEPQREPTKSSTDSTVKTVSAITPTTTTTTTTTMRRSEPTTRIESKTIAPMVDGRVLSATSVSNAMNKMNDTVLDTQTLMKDHGISKLSPSVNTSDGKSNETATRNNTELDMKSTTTGVEMSETTDKKTKENNHRYNNNNNNNNSNHITSTGIIPARLLDEHVQNNMAKLIRPDNNLISNAKSKNINEMLKESRTVVADDVKPIRITVKEKPMDVDVQSGNIRFDTANGINERPSLPPTQPVNPNEQPQETQDAVERNRCARFFSNFRNKLRCKRNNKPKETINIAKEEQGEKPGCFNCRKKKKPDVTINIENDEPKKRFWQRFKCCKSKVSDKSEDNTRKDSWTDRRDSIFSGPIEKKSWWRRIFCLDKCRKSKKPLEDPASRRASMMSKKKSLTSSVPVEDNTPKLDLSLVEHNSTMRGAIPVLPVSLAWFCLVMNCIIPGTGTIFSGIFCLCLGIPRFSQKDGPRSRLGAFIIDTIIGVGQCFTVLFCLVGWGWSIWWGVIMLKIAKKHRKIKALEAEAEKQEAGARRSSQQRDIERGT